MADDAEARREEARRALEGAERTQQREAAERQRGQQEELNQLTARLNAIQQDKERLELTWVELDNSKRSVRAVLEPILNEEKQTETEEANLEAEEAKTGVPSEKHQIEEKRWAAQAKRQETEKKKWVEEEKMVKLDQKVEDQTQAYRRLLDEEEQIKNRLEQLKTGATTQ